MIYKGNKHALNLIGNKFIKEAYLGNKQLLGFNKTLYYNSDDSRVDCAGYNGEDFSKGGYLIYNAICSKLTAGVINIWDPGGKYNMVDVYIREFGTGNQLYRYNISVSAYSSLSNFTLKFTLYNASGSELKSTTWKTDYAFGSSFTLFEYSFETNQWLFQFISGNSYNYEPQTLAINGDYVPCFIQAYNVSGRNGARVMRLNATIQD